MMNNPPAFPVSEAIVANEPKYQGMALRDYFAGQALAGMCANPDISKAMCMINIPPKDVRKSFAESAYIQADAMLAEREKGHQ